MIKNIFTAIFLSFTCTFGYSQNPNVGKNSIEKEFSELIETSNTFKGYKVVDYEKLTSLQNSTSAFIGKLEMEILDYQESLEVQKETNVKLQSELQEIKADLEEVTAEKEAITFFGLSFSKSSYKIVMWGIVGILLLTLIFFIIRFQRSHIHTKEARKNLAETEKEFEAFKIKSLEKEQRLGRLLQDERNKLMKIIK